MTTIFIPTLIESQEHGDSLPDMTVAIRAGRWPRILLKDETGQHWAAGDVGPLTNADMTGWTALVPTVVGVGELGELLEDFGFDGPILSDLVRFLIYHGVRVTHYPEENR